MILSGVELSKKMKGDLKKKCIELTTKMQRKPSLHVLFVGDNPASSLYVSMKKYQAETIGILAATHHFEDSVSEGNLLNYLEKFNSDPLVDGILIQLPLPKSLNTKKILNYIDPSKDVDGLTSANLGLLLQGSPYLIPCTPLGCMQLIQNWKSDITGLNAVVVGRSTLVGLPMSILLNQANATVTVCHSHTKNLEALTRQADILVVACGTPGLIGLNHVKQGACVIDVGINRLSDGRLVGDVDYESVETIAGAITPVPGGVGPMTVYNLLANTILAAEKRFESSHQSNK
jgi:methylenetetrahydrofolate dehydrogenase (NADP+)/methenyltetrahydrofolate cyclohydrolase